MITLPSFFEWFAQNPLGPKDAPWLIFGKGPSFLKRDQYDLGRFHTLALNHAVREQPVDIAHIIDVDVVDACADTLARQARVVVMPWRPHVKNFPCEERLPDMVARIPVLAELAEQNRLLWYDLSTTDEVHGQFPVVRVRYFSIEAAINLLATAGVRSIRTLGIDGGATYSSEFADLKDKTLLANGRSNFDQQFEEIARSIRVFGLDYGRLDVECPIRVYVGSTPSEMLPFKVLEYSLKKHASMTTEVFPLFRANIPLPLPKDAKNQPRTPFSFQRFLIPQLAGFSGHAIYVDSDMQLFQDVAKLWTMRDGEADLLASGADTDLGRRPQFSVMLLDCERLQWQITEIIAMLDDGRLTYEHLMQDMPVATKVSACVPAAWNSLENYQEGVTALIHYTDMGTQPWVSFANPLGYLWVRDLFEAIDAGFISREFLDEQIASGFVRPSLAFQVDRRIEDPILLPRKARELDTAFIAPYRAIPKHSGTPWVTPSGYARALLRRIFSRGPLMKIQRRIRAWQTAGK